ncbi:MAG: hypothetical protein V4721_10375 [Bacteroidota bacterium]
MKKSTSTKSPINERLIEELINKRKLTNYAIAKALNVYISNVDAWLVGRSPGKGKPKQFVVPNIDYLVALCKEYDMNLHYLATGEQAPSQKTSKKVVESEQHKESTQQSYDKNVPEKAMDELFKQYTEMYNNMQKSIDELEMKYVKLKGEVHQIQRSTTIKN